MKNNKGGSKVKYEATLFDTGFVHRVDIRIAEADWADLLKNAIYKTRYNVDLTIDGETMKNVAFSAKGMSSLIFPSLKPGNKRYSFKVLFGKNKKGQTCHGLDELDLNCCFRDTTLMKDYFSYRLFHLAGVPAPLTGYAWVTVNGKDLGLYLLVEKPEESFLARTFGKGVLYKPQTSDLERTPEAAVAKAKDLIENGESDIGENGIPEDYELDESEGADFVYIDDDPASYPGIFTHRKTDGGKKDDAAVIASIKTLSQGTKLKKGLDTHEIIRFFAAHNFLLSYDSYTGTSLQNMLICEKEGILSVIPWDYNLVFGTFVTGIGKEVLEDPTNLLNQGIDTPLIGTKEARRPLWAWIMQNEKYRQEYHEVLSELIEKYFESGMFEDELNALQGMLAPYQAKDPNAFYSKKEFKKGCEVLRQFALRRAQSIRKQLNGELAMDSAKQNDSDKVRASDLNVMDMGAYVYLPKELQVKNAVMKADKKVNKHNETNKEDQFYERQK